MDFDPLSLFTPGPQVESEGAESFYSTKQTLEKNGDIVNSDHTTVVSHLIEEDDLDLEPLHVHDLPLLKLKPPAVVLSVFLKLLSPPTIHNFGPQEETVKDTNAVLSEKQISQQEVAISLSWLIGKGRFSSLEQLAAVAELAESLRMSFPSQYNEWLTRIVSSDLEWLGEEQKEEIHALAALRLAENCGRTAQPEFIRHIEIPGLPKKIYLKEPSLTSDNLGLKTWGSLFILGRRLAAKPAYLKGSVLELGSGTGLVGIVSCILGFPTMLTDLPEIMPNLEDNIELNSIVQASADCLDWSDPASFLEKHKLPTYTTIILSDPLYSSRHPPWIVSMINAFLEKDTEARVLLQVPIRKTFENERARLWELLEANGYEVEEEDREIGYDDFGETTFLFKKLRRRN